MRPLCLVQHPSGVLDMGVRIETGLGARAILERHGAAGDKEYDRMMVVPAENPSQKPPGPPSDAGLLRFGPHGPNVRSGPMLEDPRQPTNLAAFGTGSKAVVGRVAALGGVLVPSALPLLERALD